MELELEKIARVYSKEYVNEIKMCIERVRSHKHYAKFAEILVPVVQLVTGAFDGTRYHHITLFGARDIAEYVKTATLCDFLSARLRVRGINEEIESTMKKLVCEHYTPYSEEISTIQLLPQILPQPIAEAITECIEGVMIRRFKLLYPYVYDNYTTYRAWKNEVHFTYNDMYNPKFYEYLVLPEYLYFAATWEEAAINIHEYIMNNI